MRLQDSKKYMEDIDYIANLPIPWVKLQNSSVLISGASGMVGSCLIDSIMKRNIDKKMNCKVYALGRNIDRAKVRFNYCWHDINFQFVACDINQPFTIEGIDNIDYVLQMASNTHPMAYATDPIGTITTNIIGTNNLLEFAVEHSAKRFVFVSSNEIYGENRGDVEFFDEMYCGYIDSNTMRAGYPESKRCGEALCQAYNKQRNLDVVIPRLTRSYGPTMLMSDTKAISQFIRKGVKGENIVLKSAGNQFYSYTYVADAVSGLLTVLLCGNTCEAYNIADQSGDIKLKDLATVIAEYAGTNVIFEYPDETEKSGYSTATKARLDGSKIKGLGWSTRYSIRDGMIRTLDILKEIDSEAR